MKAYELNLDRIIEGYRCSPVVVYADTRGKAKSIMWEDIKYDNYGLNGYGDKELSFLNLPIKRAKEYDKVKFEGKYLTKVEIEDIERKRNRIENLDNLLKDDNISHCYIVKRGSYYMPNSCGYTSIKTRAGIYKKEDAVGSAKSCEDISLEVIDNLKHNNMILKEIEQLKNKLI